MKKIIMGAMAAALVTAAPIGKAEAFWTYQAETIENLNIVGSGFDALLAKEYVALSLFERDEMTDWDDAEHYADRAIMAADGAAPEPYDPPDRPFHRDIWRPGQLEALQAGRDRLMTVFGKGARSWYPRQAAMAQSRFDCWVEQEEEGWQLDHIADCRKEFIYYLRWIEANIDGRTLYFDFNKSDIRPDTSAKLDELVAELEGLEDVGIVAIGHADRVDTRAYNKALGMRRAEAVRDALAARGVNASIIDMMRLVSEGEDNPAVPTADGVREQENRRVILLRDDRM